MPLQRLNSRVCRKKHKSSVTADDSITKYAHNSQAQRVFKTAPLYAVTNPEEAAPQDIWATFTTFFESLWSPSTNPDGTTVQKAGMSYVYDEDGTLIAQTLTGGAQSSWGQSARYVYLPTAVGPMPVAAIYGTKHYAIQSDHLNTPRRLIQSDGQVAWQWAYSAFGEEKPTIAKNRFANTDLNQSFGTTAVPAVTFNLRYPGQYFDQESNLHYNYHRSYSATTGRYTQADPIGLDGGWNRFGYSNQNPMSYVDPLGQEAITIVVGGSVLAVGCLMSTGCSGAVGSALSTGAKAVGNAASNVVEAINDFCTLGDPCDEIRKQIRDLKAQIAKRELQLASDQWDLFNKAYAVNPGGALAGKGTYLGHIGYIESLRVGLVGKIAQAKAMGCL